MGRSRRGQQSAAFRVEVASMEMRGFGTTKPKIYGFTTLDFTNQNLTKLGSCLVDFNFPDQPRQVSAIFVFPFAKTFFSFCCNIFYSFCYNVCF
jgi:hypothetical protein